MNDSLYEPCKQNLVEADSTWKERNVELLAPAAQ